MYPLTSLIREFHFRDGSVYVVTGLRPVTVSGAPGKGAFYETEIIINERL